MGRDQSVEGSPSPVSCKISGIKELQGVLDCKLLIPDILSAKYLE
jgi:hypothetical protein